MKQVSVGAVIEKVLRQMGVLKGQPTSSDVHVPSAGADYPPEHKQPVRLSKDQLVRPEKTAGQLHKEMIDSHDTIGGTIKHSKDGSEYPVGSAGGNANEKFVFGPMTFDIDKAREMSGGKPNSTAAVSADWSHKINVDTKAALKSKNPEPVIIAQIPSTNGAQKLLIDGHHRMFKALHEGKTEVPAFVMSPEQTMGLMETHPDLMKKMYDHIAECAEDPANGQVDKDTLGYSKRQRLADESFAMPKERKYPIHDISHARNALARASGKPEEAKVKAAVYRKYPSLKPEKTNKDTNENQLENASASGGRSSGGMGDNALAGMYNMQSIVDGMDWELAHDTIKPDYAKEIAMANLEDDPMHYRKLRLEEDGTDWGSDWGLDGQLGKGLKFDLGSGENREKGHIGFDLVKHDHGTVVHDLHMGIPAPDESASKVIMRNSLDYMDELREDPKPILSEIMRVLMPGGQFVYEGPNQIQNQPEWLKETKCEKFTHDGTGDIEKRHRMEDDDDDEDEGEDIDKIEGQPMFRQSFERIAVPDAATANDSEPRIGIAQYDMLPADALLAMDALGYYWSDATSSGRGNRLHGYASQGALVKGEHDQENIDDLEQALLTFLEEEKAEPTQKIHKALSGKTFPIFKADGEKQIVYGVVLAPNETDLQEDWMRPEEIEKTAHFFMMNGQTIGREHQEKAAKVVPVESYIAPVDFPCEGQYGDQMVKKGSWVLGVKVMDPEDWEKVKSGEYTGFSVGGWGQRTDSDGPESVSQQW
jgi:SAM-dependent methyltransferase